MSSGDTQHKAGFEITAKDELSKVLRSYATQLTRLEGLLAKVKAEFGAVDSAAPKGLGKQAETMAKYLGSARQVVGLGREIAKVNEQSAKTDGIRAVLAERKRVQEERASAVVKASEERTEAHNAKQILSDERLLSMQEQRIQRQKASEERQETHATRIAETTIRIAAMAVRSEEQSAAAAVRLEAAQLRVAMLKERQARAAHNQTADERKILDFQERIAGLAPGAGNSFGYGQMVAGQGVGILRGVMGVGQDHDLRHYLQEQTSFQQMNLSAGDNQRAMTAAEAVRRQVHGLGMAGALDVVKDLINVTGHVNEATDPLLMKRFAQFRVSNKVAYGLSDAQSYNAIKAAELLTPGFKGMTQDQQRDAIIGKLELENKVMGGTAGKVGPNDLLAFAKTAQSSRMALTDNGLLKLTGVIQEYGGNRAGTSLMSVMQNLANGRATTQSVKNLLDMGLINQTVNGKSMVEYDKTGRVKRMLPGAIKDDTQLRQDPVAWAEKHLMPKIQGKSLADVDRMVNSIMGNRTAAGLMMTILSQDGRLNKEFSNALRARGIENTDQSQNGNYFRAEQDFAMALSDLRVKVGLKVLPALTTGLERLTTLFERLSAAVDAHPTATKAIVGGTAAVGGAMVLGGAGFMAKGAYDGLKFLGGAARGAGGGLMRMLGLSAAEGEEAVGLFARLAPWIARAGTLMTGLAEAGAAVGAVLTGPVIAGIALVGAAVAAGVVAWKTNFLGFRSVCVGVGHVIHANWVRFTGAMSGAWSGMVARIKGAFASLPGYIGGMLSQIPYFDKLMAMAGNAAGWAKSVAEGFNRSAQQAASQFATDAEEADRQASGGGGDNHYHFHGPTNFNGVKDVHGAHKAIHRHVNGPGKAQTPGMGGAAAF